MEFWIVLIVAGTVVQAIFSLLTIREYRRHGDYLRLIQNSRKDEPKAALRRGWPEQKAASAVTTPLDREDRTMLDLAERQMSQRGTVEPHLEPFAKALQRLDRDGI